MATAESVTIDVGVEIGTGALIAVRPLSVAFTNRSSEPTLAPALLSAIRAMGR